jgi:hypothetical protein
MRNILKTILLGGLFTISCAFATPQKDSYEDVYNQVDTHASKQLEIVKKKKLNEDLYSYDYTQISNEELLNQYAEGRMWEAKKADYGFTDEIVEEFLNTPGFMKDFRAYLNAWQKSTFFVTLENDILNASRPSPINGERQAPTLNPDLRKQNIKLANSYGVAADELYSVLHNQMLKKQGEKSIYK